MFVGARQVWRCVVATSRSRLLVVHMRRAATNVVACHSRDTSLSDGCSARGWSQLHRMSEEVADPLVTAYSLQRVNARSTGVYVKFLWEAVNDPSAGAGYIKREETGFRARNVFTLPRLREDHLCRVRLRTKDPLYARDENRSKT